MPIFVGIAGFLLLMVLGIESASGLAIGLFLVGFFYLHIRLNRLERARYLQPTSSDDAKATSAVRPALYEPISDTQPEIRVEQTSTTEQPNFETQRDVAYQRIPISERIPALGALLRFFSTGNTFAKVGAVVLFFGVSFLLKYVSDQGLFPIEMRLAASACAAFALLVLGWRFRNRQGAFGLVLQAAGIGIFYLTVFAAFRLYALLPSPPAFALLIITVILASFLAIAQNSMAFAVLSASGGFLAPVLISTGKGSHIALFSYYAVLNIGILVISKFRAWRELNIVGFLFTFVISALWGYNYYKPEYFHTTEPFLVFFFLLYVLVAVLFAGKQRDQESLVVDGTIVFGVPVVGFALQSALVKDLPYGNAWSALALGAFYVILAQALFARLATRQRLLVEAFLAIGVCFLTLAIPLALDGRWTASIWAAEGAAIFWAGTRQNRLSMRSFGLLLQIGAGIAFALAENRSASVFPIANAFFLGTTILALAHIFTAYILFRAELPKVGSNEKQLGPLFLAIGVAWWFFGGVVELNQSVETWCDWFQRAFESLTTDKASVLVHILVLFCSASFAAFVSFSRRVHWPLLGKLYWAFLPILALLALTQIAVNGHPSQDIGIVAWISALWIQYHLLRGIETQAENSKRARYWHVGGLWLIAWLLSAEAFWIADQLLPTANIWSIVSLALVPALLSWIIIRISIASRGWPLGAHRGLYQSLGVIPLLAWAWICCVFLNLSHTGDPGIVPYIPLLNPLDLTQMLVFLVIGRAYVQTDQVVSGGAETRRPFVIALSISAFIWLTAVLIRTLHHWTDIAWQSDTLFHSTLVQASLSVFWSLIALAFMVIATRRGWRLLWLCGVSLLALVVVKLVVIDMSSTGTLARIGSFIGTGVLLLVVGYLAPLPPEKES